MSILFNDLSFSKDILDLGDNTVTISYTGSSTTPDGQLELEVQAEPLVNFKVDHVLKHQIQITNKLGPVKEKHSEILTINVSQKFSILFPVTFCIYAEKGTPEEKKRRRTIRF